MQEDTQITVHFIDVENGQTIGISEMPSEQLPQTFEVDTTLTIHNERWQVQEAIPAQSADFIKAKKLLLKVAKVHQAVPEEILFSLPTLSNELPQTVNQALFNDFELTIAEDDWRQNEFLLLASFPLVDIELEKIKVIWENHSKPVDENFTAFDKLHVRETIGEPNLSLDFNHLQSLLGTHEIGCLKLKGNEGFVRDAFVLQTPATTYYGVLRDDRVTHLCISAFADDTLLEVQAITNAFHLLFVSWYHGDIFTADEE